MLDSDRPAPASQPEAWLTVKDAARRARCSDKIIYRAAKGRKLKHSKLNDRGDMRFKATWIDEWLERCAVPVEVE